MDLLKYKARVIMIKFSYNAENSYPPEFEWRLFGEFGAFNALKFEKHLMRVYANKQLESGQFSPKETFVHA